MKKYIMLNKAVGETPLSCAKAYRSEHPELEDVSMAYAGRLDPMASGKLLVLLGEECKNQTAYHSLDKQYEFSVLLGISSDSHDVLGRLATDSTVNLTHPLLVCPSQTHPNIVAPSLSPLQSQLTKISDEFIGNIELPYPHFSAKTVQGKPLHMWTLEGRLDEIQIPTKESTIHSLQLDCIETKSRTEVCTEARIKIDSIPEVTEARKTLGNDFRRVDVRSDWEDVLKNDSLPDFYHIAHFTCIASSGTYMRTLADLIGQKLSPAIPSLAWSIHRTKIGIYDSSTSTWKVQY
jgi:tRNA U55 pseudouridine synthase TruB